MNIHLRLLLLAGAAIFFGYTLYYIRKKQLDLYHSIRWFVLSALILAMALFPELLTVLAHVAGIEIPSNLVFLIMIVYLMLTCLSLSASVSRQHARIRTLVQEAALMEKRICELERRIKASEENDDDIVAREAYKDKSR
ncbi:MAG: DUF2304 domain-containing protein [Blautia sp.]|nr:DUF2304 domain-containing protein [Blautia sp.]